MAIYAELMDAIQTQGNTKVILKFLLLEICFVIQERIDT